MPLQPHDVAALRSPHGEEAPPPGGLFPIRGLPRVLERFHAPPARLSLLCGGSQSHLAGLLLGSAARRPVAVVDGGMKFSSYTLARLAPLLGVPPALLLRRVHVTRAFTAFQAEAAVTVKLPRFAAAAGCTNAVLLDILETYYDEQISPFECRRSLLRMTAALRRLVGANVNVLLVAAGVSDPPPGKGELLGILAAAAERILTLRPQEGELLISEEGHGAQ